MKKSKHSDLAQPKALLDDSPSHLLHRVLQIALDIYTVEVGEGALTQRQYALLKALDGSQGMTQTDLVKATGIDRSTLADLVGRMITKGFLARERSTTDARANLVHLAEAGQTALLDMHPRVLAADEKILSLLSPPKRESFVKLLRKMTLSREGEPSLTESSAQNVDVSGLMTKSIDKAAKKADKKKKGHKKLDLKKPDSKKADKFTKKLKKLPMPGLSEGVTAPTLELPATSSAVDV